MEIVDKFNGLNGVVVTRADLQKRISEARRHEQHHIVKKLQNVLDSYPEKESFKLEIVNPAVEIIPDSLLHCLECEQASDEENGLAKAVSPNEVYQMITDKMISMIKDAKAKDWKKGWDGKSKSKGSGYTIPFNFVSKKRYRGVNIFLLTNFSFLENPFFLTFKQVEELGGSVKKGAKGHPVVYFTQLFRVSDSAKDLDFGTYDKGKAKDFAAENSISEIDEIPILKYYNVFNGADITGIDFDLKNFTTGLIVDEAGAEHENKLPVAEAIITNFPKPQLPLRFGGDGAYYNPAKDFIQMPTFESFNTVQDYYATLFHEFSHSTGHKKRLDRDMSGRNGNKKYAFEELIAEFGATFLSAEAGIIWHSNANHASYLKSWNSALTIIENDNRFIMKAATQAQKIADYILQFNKSGEPLYFKDLKAEASKIEKLLREKTAKQAKKKAEVKKKTTVRPGIQITSPVNAEITVPDQPKKKKDPNQLALFGAKKESLNAFITEEQLREVAQKNKMPEQLPVLQSPLQKEPKPVCKNPRIMKIGSDSDEASEFYTVAGEVGKFLQQVEKKPFESVVITMDGMQGAGKTTTLYHFMDAFATPGNKCLFISGEEHPQSHLATSKAKNLLTEASRQNIDIVGDVKDVDDLYSLVKDYDICFIDSWQKLLRMVGTIRLDEDLRKKFNGKVFVIIFQQTTEGRTKGGAEVVFDGDIIIKMVKGVKFEENYAYFDKHRYTLVPIETIRYNIAGKKIYNPEEPAQAAQEPEAVREASNESLSFTYKEN